KVEDRGSEIEDRPTDDETILNPRSSILDPQLFRRGVSHTGALWYIPADTKSQNIQSQTEKR
ncbi:MAG TPA: hypothetical protein VG324_25630, partial [Blastocatellia bacterium]|nr:hypothetical protein [Blastocatellia bacterium]